MQRGGGNGSVPGLPASPFGRGSNSSSIFASHTRSQSPTAASSGSGHSSMGLAHGPPGMPPASSDFDASDFPALSSDSQRGLSLPPPGALSYAATGHSHAGPASSTPAPPHQHQLHQLNSAHATRELTAEDFPALGGQAGSNGAPGSGAVPSTANTLNGLPSAPARPVQMQQEQAAAAALAHRQGLLGSLTGANAGAMRQLSLDEQKRLSQAHMLSNTPSPVYANGLQAQQQQQQQQHLRSPSGSIPPPPSGPRSTQPQQPNSSSRSSSIALATANTPLINGSSSIVPAAAPTQASQDPAMISDQAPIQQQPSHQQSQQQQGSIPQTPAQQVLLSPADRFGLVGLLQLIKTGDPDSTMLALGSDLSKLGLDMNRKDNLSATCVTPWADADSLAHVQIEPEFSLPSCYNVHPPSATSKIGQLHEETLFYIFYAQPKDVLQEAAAHELYKHNWRYHKELKLWLTKESGIEPTQKTTNYERGTYLFFQPQTWEKVKKEFVLVYDQLEKTAAAQS